MSVSEALAERGLSLALAESCTGGMVAARLTDRPGASRFLEAGLVTYSNAAKESLLGVERATLEAHGAVSEAVARAMLDGARRATGADAAIAITGIAGPEGGTPEKPVGTVWIGAALGADSVVRRFQLDGDRAAIREASVDASLELLLTLLEARR
jgi:PncC family amidohydrolase